ncbi:MAG: cell division protein FtsQ/DivIB [Candidatus Krumholzibacteriales bacterium]
MAARRKTLMASSRSGPGFSRYIRLAALPVLVIAAAGSFIYFWYFTGCLSIQRIDLYGNKGLPVDSLSLITERYIGENILTVQLDQLENEIMENPDVAGVVFDKDYPHRLDCYLRERKPVAAVLCGRVMEVDEDGVVLSERISSGGVDLPLITGVEDLEGEEGRRALAGALEALRIFKKYGFSPAKHLSEIHMENEEIIFIWLDVGSVIRVGKDNIEERIQKLRSIYHFLEQKGSFPEMVDLRFKHQVVVR